MFKTDKLILSKFAITHDNMMMSSGDEIKRRFQTYFAGMYDGDSAYNWTDVLDKCYFDFKKYNPNSTTVTGVATRKKFTDFSSFYSFVRTFVSDNGIAFTEDCVAEIYIPIDKNAPYPVKAFAYNSFYYAIRKGNIHGYLDRDVTLGDQSLSNYNYYKDLIQLIYSYGGVPFNSSDYDSNPTKYHNTIWFSNNKKSNLYNRTKTIDLASSITGGNRYVVDDSTGNVDTSSQGGKNFYSVSNFMVTHIDFGVPPSIWDGLFFNFNRKGSSALYVSKITDGSGKVAFAVAPFEVDTICFNKVDESRYKLFIEVVRSAGRPLFKFLDFQTTGHDTYGSRFNVIQDFSISRRPTAMNYFEFYDHEIFFRFYDSQTGMISERGLPYLTSESTRSPKIQAPKKYILKYQQK